MKETGDDGAAQAAGDGAVLLRRRDVAALLAVCGRTVDRLVAQELLPPPLRLARSVRWRRRDVLAALDKLAGERRQ